MKRTPMGVGGVAGGAACCDRSRSSRWRRVAAGGRRSRSAVGAERHWLVLGVTGEQRDPARDAAPAPPARRQRRQPLTASAALGRPSTSSSRSCWRGGVRATPGTARAMRRPTVVRASSRCRRCRRLPPAAGAALAQGGAGARRCRCSSRRQRRRHQFLGADPDAAVLHGAVVPARDPADDDGLHAHRDRPVAVPPGDRHAGRAAQPGDRRAVAVPDLLRDVADHRQGSTTRPGRRTRPTR